MKRVFVAIMILVCVMVGVIYAEDMNLVDYSEAIEMLYEYAEKYGYTEYVEEDVIDGCKLYCGCLSKEEFERQLNLACTIQNWMDVSEKEFEMESLVVNNIGEIEGHTIYQAIAEASKPLAYDSNGEYFKVKVLFMICK